MRPVSQKTISEMSLRVRDYWYIRWRDVFVILVFKDYSEAMHPLHYSFDGGHLMSAALIGINHNNHNIVIVKDIDNSCEYKCLS